MYIIRQEVYILLDNILELIYPPKCGICNKFSKEYLCKKCELRLLKIFNYKQEKYLEKYFSNHIYLFEYNSVIRKIILEYKFNEKPYLYHTFSTFIKKHIEFENYDLVIPIPISKKRYKERGYNQSYLIAKDLVKKYNLKIDNTILLKTKNNIMQSSLDKKRKRKQCNWSISN